MVDNFQQQLDLALVKGPDLSSPFYSSMRPEPTAARLASSHTIVMVKNTSPNQNHIVIDRYNVGHELRPGERREMDMLDDEIMGFLENRKPDRFYPLNDPNQPAKPKPLHPIEIVGYSPSPSEDERQAAVARVGNKR